MSINTTPTAYVTLNGKPREFVKHFTHLVVSSVNIMEPQKTSKQDWVKPAVVLPNFGTLGSSSSIP